MMKKSFFLVVLSSGLCFLPLCLGRSVNRKRRTKQLASQPAKVVADKQAQKLTEPRVKPKVQKIVVPGQKKSILILSSIGGGGHTAVSSGLCDYLGDDYDVTVVNALQDVFGPVDTIKTLSFGKLCGEGFYNLFLRCGWTNLTGKYAHAGSSYMLWRHGVLVKLMVKYCKREQYDLVISVMPKINAAVLEACEQLDLPFLILTNDLDTTNYINGIYKPTYKKLRYTLAFDDPVLWKKIEKAQIPKEQVVITGFPLRPEFFTPKDVPALKKKFKVPSGKPVVMVFMGGAGSQASYRYVRTLARMKKPMHIFVCLGRNERLRRNIKKILLPPGVTISIIGFTNRIPELMAISDVLITKPGPGSVCEGRRSYVPMISDETHGIIWWEQENIDFMVKHGFAESLTDYKDLDAMLPKYLEDSTFTDGIKKRMKAFKCERFDKKIKPLIRTMFTL